MAEHEIKVVIGAKDEASKQIKAIDKDLVALTKRKATIEVDLSTDDARKQLEDVTEQIEKLQKEKAEIVVEAKVRDALDALDAVATEAKKAETAAEALANALGPELGGKADLDGIVSDFQRMGLSLEEITANADRLAAKVTEIGQHDVGGNLTTGFSRIDESAKSAGSSASVLANTIGNTAQDLGALGGVAGTAGVALGQMGEYMADAALSGEGFASVIGNFAKVLGPVAAVSIAVGVITKLIGEHNKRQEEMARAIQATTDAFQDGIGSLEDWKSALDQSITEGTADAGDALNKFMVDALEGAGHLEDVQEATGALGLTFEDLGKGLVAADADFQVWARGVLKSKGVADGVAETVAKTIDNVGDFKDIINLLELDGIDTRGLETVIRALNEIDDAVGDLDLEKSARAFLNSEAAINAETQARVANARVGTQTQIDALENYIAATIAANAADKKRTDEEKAHEDALQATLTALKDAQAAQEEFARSVAEGNLALLDAGAASEAFAEAMARIDAGAEVFDSQRMQKQVAAADEFAESLKKAREEGVNLADTDLTPDSVAELTSATRNAVAGSTDALAGWRASIQAELTDAFDTGGIDAYVAKFDMFAADIPARVRQMFAAAQPGISTADLDRQVQEVLDTLGVIPEAKDIQIRLTREEEIRNALDAFAGVISDLDENAEIEINTMIAQGDIDAAFNLLNTELINRGYPPIQIGTVTTPPPQTNIDSTLRTVQAALNRRPLDVPLQGRWVTQMGNSLFDAGGTVPAAGGIVAEKRPEIINGRFLVTSPSVVPPGTRVTGGAKTARILRTRGTRGLRRFDSGGVVPSGPVIVNFNGVGAIGNRYDLMRTVQRANLDKQRLLGSRG